MSINRESYLNNDDRHHLPALYLWCTDCIRLFFLTTATTSDIAQHHGYGRTQMGISRDKRQSHREKAAHIYDIKQNIKH